MQTVSAAFDTRTAAAIRKVTTKLFISFQKDFDPLIDFFTIGVSTIGGTDILKGDGSVVQEWEKYSYTDYSDRIISAEVNRETEPPTSPVTLATCDLVLDNHDDIFTPGNAGSPLVDFLVSRRPVRLNVGFGNETVPKFVGVTLGKPKIDERSKTAKFHCIDFLSSIMNVPLDEEVIYENILTGAIVQALLERGGLSASQFDLDSGSVVIPFAYFKKGMTIGDALREVAEAEIGNVNMTEAGVTRFEDRINWNSKLPSYTYDKDNMLERESLDVDTVINDVRVYSRARQVQTKQPVWQGNAPVRFSDGAISILPGETKEIFADFKDDFGELPVTTIDDPEPSSLATTSVYVANTLSDGSGDDISGDVGLDSSDLFSTAIKLTFTNNGSDEAFLTQVELWGTPARVIADIYERTTDDASIGEFDAFEQHIHEIRNDLIQDATAARTIGQIIVSDRSQDDDQQKWIIKAVPHQQVGDVVTYDELDADEDYFVTRVNDIINSSGYRQVLQVSKRTINIYFRIGISTIGGPDPLGP